MDGTHSFHKTYNNFNESFFFTSSLKFKVRMLPEEWLKKTFI